jgi:hypothetical protein
MHVQNTDIEFKSEAKYIFKRIKEYQFTSLKMKKVSILNVTFLSFDRKIDNILTPRFRLALK